MTTTGRMVTKKDTLVLYWRNDDGRILPAFQMRVMWSDDFETRQSLMRRVQPIAEEWVVSLPQPEGDGWGLHLTGEDELGPKESEAFGLPPRNDPRSDYYTEAA